MGVSSRVPEGQKTNSGMIVVCPPVLKTQASLPSEKAALLVFFGLFAGGQVKMRRIEGWFDLAHAPAA